MQKKIDRVNVEDIVELNMVQEGMLYHYLKDENNNLYNVQLSFNVKGNLNVPVLQEAFDRVQSAHQVLRSVFRWKELNKSVQIILYRYTTSIAYTDLSQLETKDQDLYVEDYLRKDWHERFDLSEPPLRLHVIQLADQSFVFTITHHHILYDGWSTAILFKDLFYNYSQLINDRQPLTGRQSSYKDISLAIKRSFIPANGDKFWRDYLNGYQRTAAFPNKYADAAANGRLEKEVLTIRDLDLDTFCSTYNVTRAAIVYAAYAIFLQKWQDVSDIVVGTAVSTRSATIKDQEHVMGNFINTIPLRLQDTKDQPFYEVVIQLNRELLTRNQFVDTSYSDIKRMLRLKPSDDLFDSVIAIENYPVHEAAINGSGLDLQLRSVNENTGIPLMITVFFREGLELEFAYDTGVVSNLFIKALGDFISRGLMEMLRYPEVKIKEIELVREPARHNLLYEFNNTSAEYPRSETIMSLFEQQVQQTPGNIAVKFANGAFTYGDLNAAADQMASWLRNVKGITTGDLVGVMLDREQQLIPAVFGILKAGAAYVPLDVNSAAERVTSVILDANLKGIITRGKYTQALETVAGIIIDLDKEQDKINDHQAGLIPIAVKGNDLAYVIFTSGSTGKPKGVMIEHHSVVNRLVWMQKEYRLTSNDVLLQKTPLVFDVSVWELLWWAMTGASLCLLETGAEKDPRKTIRAIQDNGVTTIHFVPSMLNGFLSVMDDTFDFNSLKSLRYVFASGEALTPLQVAGFSTTIHRYCSSRLVNLYGPTEATVDVSYHECDLRRNYVTVPIGKPIDNTRLYIVNKDNQLLPPGAVGELCIAGAGLARGYLNREDLTREKFVPCPFREGERMYKTGDLARWRTDGDIEFLGRMDDQVKIRGVRIEPGEIEYQLLTHKEVKEALVIEKEYDGQKFLGAYYVAGSPLDAHTLKIHLAAKLPDYMIPAYFMQIPAIPLTTNGKPDRTLLPEPGISFSNGEETLKDTSEAEQQLVKIWAAVLGHDKIGIHKSFFDIGGDSLNALKVVNRIYRELHIELSIREFFDNSTIRQLSSYLERSADNRQTAAGPSGRTFKGLRKAEKKEYYSLSLAQRRLYFLNQFDKSSLAYNAPLSVRLEGTLDKSRLFRALQELIHRNESFRTYFQIIEGAPCQIILEEVELAIEEYASDDEEGISRQFVRPFDLGVAPLIRVGLIKRTDLVHILLVDLHHIITDGMSKNLLIKEFMDLYGGKSLPAPLFTYHDYAEWQQSAEYRSQLLRHRSFWLNEFREEPVSMALPLDYRRPLIRSYKGHSIHFSLNAYETARLKMLGDSEAATQFMVLLSLYSILLGRLTGQKDLVIGTPTSGRDHADLENIPGVFMNAVVIRTGPGGTLPYRDFLQQIKSKTIAVFDNQAYPFESLVDELKVTRDTTRNLLFDVWFSYQNFEEDTPQLADLSVTARDLYPDISVYDLSLNTVESEGQLHLNFTYSTDLFKSETIQRFVGYFLNIVKAVIADANCLLMDIELVTGSEKRLLLQEFNNTAIPIEREKTLFTLFSEQALRTPDRIAVEHNGAGVSYSEMLWRATKLSVYLISKGVKAGSRVALYMPRGNDMLISIVGIMGAGAAYVPIETEYPQHRVKEILADSEVEIVLVNGQSISAAGEIRDDIITLQEIVCIDDLDQWPVTAAALPQMAGPGDIAYIIYTSGTTGKPKGAMIHQLGMLNHMYALIGELQLTEMDAIAQTASCSFDISVWQLLCALLIGGRTCIIDKEKLLDAGSLLEEMQVRQITVAEMVPSVLRALVDEALQSAGKDLPNLRWMIPTAEQISVALVNKWYTCYPSVPLVNAYGPAEASDDVTLFVISKEVEDGYIIPIGRPIRNIRIYIVDENMKLCPVGVRGEICIAGVGVGKGYWKDPATTNRVFIDNPFLTEDENDYRNLYRTGDTGFYQQNGNIVFTGRDDDQVKIRGHRIELGEIESHLLQHHSIREVALLAREKEGSKHLVAYYVSEVTIEENVLRNYLSGRLPDHMVPSFYVRVERMPLTVNGKLDKNSLPEPQRKQLASNVEKAVTEQEKLLVTIWSKVLGGTDIGVTENFFSAGGDSIKSTQIISALRTAGYEVSVKEIFIHQTIRELAVKLKKTAILSEQKKTPFLSWPSFLADYRKSKSFTKEQAYWSKMISRQIPALPRDYSEGMDETREIQLEIVQLSAISTQRLLTDAHQRFGTHIDELLLSALLFAIQRQYGMSAVQLDIHGHGHEGTVAEVDTNWTIGRFTGIYPVLLESRSEDLSRLIREVKEILRRVPKNGIGYMLLKYKDDDLQTMGTSGSRIIFNYQDQPDTGAAPISFGAASHLNYDWELSGMVLEGQLVMNLAYSQSQYRPETIRSLMRHYILGLESIIAFCCDSGRRELTPSDLTYKDLPVEELDALQDKYSPQDVYPLSPMQIGMLFHSLYDEQGEEYFEQMSCRIQGKMDLQAVEKTMNDIISRYDVLRTVFVHAGYERALQVVLKERKIDFVFQDYRLECREKGIPAVTTVYRKQDRSRRFDLAKDVLIRLSVLQLAEEEYELILSYHHVLMDGWCMAIIMRDFKELYSANLSGVDPLLPPTKPYGEYISWLQDLGHEEMAAYWKKYLSGYEQPAHIGGLVNKQKDQSYDLQMEEWVIGQDHTQLLRKLSAEYGVTINTIIQAAWGILLSKYNNVDDVVFGAVVSGRPAEIPGVESMVGLFINTVPVRVQYEEGDTVADLLRRLQVAALDSEPHHYHPLSSIQSSSGPGRGLFDHIMVFENYPIADVIKDVDEKKMGFRVTDAELYIQTSYDLSVVVNSDETSRIKFYYNASIFDGTFIQQMAAHFNRVLEQVSGNSQMDVADIEIVTAEEKHQLVYSYNGTTIEYPRKSTVVDLFEESARQFPERTALLHNGSYMTYKDLHERSNQLANFLRNKGVKAGTVVGLMMERSVDLIIGLLGILKAGAAYLPIRLGTPEQRHRHILEESNALLLITDANHINEFSHFITTVGVGDDEINTCPVTAVTRQALPRNIAYILYTSGSTGMPKGVMITHNALANYINWACREYVNGDKLAFPLFTSIGFDLTVTSLFCPIVTGNTMVIYEEENNAWLIKQIIEDDKVGVIKLTPSHLKIIRESQGLLRSPNNNLKRFIVGGEELTTELAKDIYDLFNGNVEIINEYGPTEATVGCMIHRFDPKETIPTVPIGVPAANVKIYLLDRHLQLTARGAIGEIYISGAGIAQGYLNNDALTGEKFLYDPFAPGMRMYKTGDLARWLPGGLLEFVGRVDEQVKIRGFRVEPGEIANSLRMHEQVQDAAVIVWEKEESKYLTAYYVSGTEIDEGELRNFLARMLPDYMVPSFYVQIERMPLTANGKLDKKSLPEPQGWRPTPDLAAAATEQETLLVNIWSKVMGVVNVGVNDNFLSVGGDSIKSLQIVSRLYAAGYEVSVKEIFIHRTIRELAVRLKRTGITSGQSVVVGKTRITPIQQLFFEGTRAIKHHYNQSVMLKFARGINGQLVQRIAEKLQEHHDVLRMVFIQGPEGVFMQNLAEQVVSVDEYDLTFSSNAGAELLALCNQLQSGIDLQEGPLMKMGLFQMEGGSRLLIVIHHLVVDGVSWRILLEDIETLYRQLSSGSFLSLPQKTAPFLSWPSHLTDYRKSPAFAGAQAYWSKMIGKDAAMVPRDYPEGVNTSGQSRVETVQLSAGSTQRLLTAAHQSFGTRVTDLLLCAFLLSLRRQYGMTTVQLDIEAHGREEIVAGVDMSRTVGWFANIYPVFLKSVSEDLPQLIKEVKEILRRVPNNGMDYLLLKYTEDELQKTGTSRSRIVFNYLGQFDADIMDKAYSLAAEPTGEEMDSGDEHEYEWEIVGMVKGGELQIGLRFSTDQYKRETIRSLMDHYLIELESIIAFCCDFGRTELTPSDLTYKDLPVEELDRLQDKYSLQDVYPLSPMQEGMLFHSLYDEQGHEYFEQVSCRIQGRLDPAAVEKTMNDITSRYEVLRTVFVHEGYERSLQVVLKERRIDFEFRDCRDACQERGRSAVVGVYRQQDRSRRFDLGRDVLMRLSVLRLGEDEYELIWSYHHILMDGWCLGIIMQDFKKLYGASLSGITPLLPPAKPYGEYIGWLRERSPEEMSAYWNAYLSGYEQAASMSHLVNTQEKKPYDLQVDALVIGHEQTKGIHRLSVEHGVTINTIIQTAWGILLSKYNNVNDVVFGAVVSGRPAEIAGIESMVGLFINTVPVRLKYDEKDTVADLFGRLQESALTGEPHHYHPLSAIQSSSEPGRDLFDHIMVFENYPLADIMKDSDEHSMSFRVSGVEVYEQTNYDLSVTITSGEEIRIVFNYNAGVFESRTIQRIAAHFNRVLQQISRNSRMSVTDIEIVTADEKHQLLYSYNGPEIEYSRNSTVVDQFAEIAGLFAERPALLYNTSHMTYKDLHERSNQLARFLQDQGVRPGIVVGLMIERSMELIIGILGILKAGGTYLPMEPGTFGARNRHMLEETRALLLLTDTIVASSFIRTIGVGDEEINTYPTTEVTSRVLPENIAYILYTSGSTGRPKGVTITHGALINYINWATSQYIKGDKAAFPLFTSIGFDLTITSLFCPIVTGNTMVIYEERDNIGLIEKIIEEDKVEVIKLTPSHLRIIRDSYMALNAPGKRLKRFIVGGEELTTQLAKDIHGLFNGKVEIINEYGPTEATVGCMIHRFDPDEKMPTVPIGVPAANVRIYLLDRHQNLAAIGTIGEIYISGAGIAQGYIYNDALTRERFLDDPFVTGRRMYKTGDLARWMPGGQLEFVGRADEQVKIRGFRIEPGEIANCLRLHEQVKDAAVIAWQKDDSKYLAAYYVSDAGIEGGVLRHFLSDMLPDHMLPSFYVQIERMPLTVNGKLDKKSLPEPRPMAGLVHAAPETKEEELLTDVWERVLGRENIGVTDNFLLVGGDSIKSLQIVSRLFAAGYAVTVKEIFIYLTIRELAVKLRKTGITTGQSEVNGKARLTPIQKLFFEGPRGNKHHYNQSVLLKFARGISAELVQRIADKLQEHHDALRMVFVQGETGVIMQNLGTEMKVRVQEYDLTHSTEAATEMQALCNELQSGIDLSQGPLMKLGLFHLEGDSRWLIVIHHLVVDGVSWRILLEDIETLYRQLTAGEPLFLPKKTVSFLSWPSYLSDYRNSLSFARARVWWSKIMSKEVAVLPRDYPQGVNIIGDNQVETVQLSAALTRRLLTVAHRSFGTRINDLLACALLLSIRRKYGISMVQVDMEGHGREEIVAGVDSGRTVGWFTNLYPVVLESTSEDLPQLIKEVKETLHGVPNNGIDYLLLNYTDEQKMIDMGRSRIVFNYLGQFDADVSGEVFSITDDIKSNDVSPLENAEYDWNISGNVYDGRLTMQVGYSPAQYDHENMQMLMAYYRESLENLIIFCCNYGRAELSPSDLTYRDLSIAQLDMLQRQYEIEDIYPLSPMQEGMLFHSLLEPEADHYFVQLVCSLNGSLVMPAVTKSLNDIVARYAILRTIFLYKGYGRPLQLVVKEKLLSVDYKDVREECMNASADEVTYKYQEQDRSRKFDLANDDLMRLTILRLPDDEYRLIWSFHHILMDGWCMSIIIREFGKLYTGYRTGFQPLLSTVQPYRRYIQWLETRDKDRSAKYWSEYLTAFENLTTLPGKVLQPAEKQPYIREVHQMVISKSEVHRLRNISSECGVTMNTILQMGWGILLAKYNNTNDVVFGSVVSGRPSELDGVEDMVGLFINTIPVRIIYKKIDTVADLLKNVQSGALESEQYHYHSLSEIQSLHEPGRELFDHILIFENYPVGDEIKDASKSDVQNDFKITGAEVFEQTNYDLSVAIVPGEEMIVKFYYNANVFDSRFIQRLATHLNKVLEQVSGDSQMAVVDIEIVTAEEKYQLLYSYNSAAIEYPRKSTVIDLFAETAELFPEKAALLYNSSHMTYKELHERSGQLADFLRNKGVETGTVVGLMIERSMEMIVGILGILKAGGTYLPLESGTPERRNLHMLQESNALLLLTDMSHEAEYSSFINTVRIGDEEINRCQVIDAGCWPSPESIAYIIYTSGSTGKPKGVMARHGSLVNLIYSQRTTFGIDPGDNILQFSTVCFDASVEQIWLALTSGATLVLISREVMTDNDLFNKYISKLQVTHLNATPSFLDSITLTGNNKLKRIVAGGEECKVALAKKFAGKYQFYNLYGPTETTVTCTQYLVTESDAGRSRIPMGKGINNTWIFILGRNLELMPEGMAGELFISGDGLTHGYVNDEELTSQRFLPNPFMPGRLMYKTGDLACWLPDRNLNFLGRADDQVKIRGYRIELGEIENRLSNYALIKEVVVVVKERGREKYLAAYFTSNEQVDAAGLKDYLLICFPDYMVPSFFIQLPALPVTSNGKINKAALPNPEINRSDKYVAASNYIQERLTEIWAELTKTDISKIGINDNFFDLGGNSITLMLLNSKVNETFDCNISVASMFKLPTIEKIENFIVNGDPDMQRIAARIEEDLDEVGATLHLFGDNMPE